MEPALQIHRPSERVKRLAKAAGLDLEALKESDPERYKMMNAEKVATVHDALLNLASDVFFAAFRHHDLYRLSAGPHQTALHAFPSLSAADLKKLDDAFARLAWLEPYRTQYAFYRVVRDRRGEARMLGLPTLPAGWRGQENVLVGPFADEAAAKAWGEAQSPGERGLVFDALSQGGAWFCDVFSVEE